jgi:hypothetical protein
MSALSFSRARDILLIPESRVTLLVVYQRSGIPKMVQCTKEGHVVKTMDELQELSALMLTADSVEDRRLLHELLRQTDTEIDTENLFISERD